MWASSTGAFRVQLPGLGQRKLESQDRVLREDGFTARALHNEKGGLTMRATWCSAILVVVITLTFSVSTTEAQDSGASSPSKGPVTLAGSGSGNEGPMTTGGTAGIDFSLAPFAKSPWFVLTEDSIAYPGHFVGIGTLNP